MVHPEDAGVTNLAMVRALRLGAEAPVAGRGAAGHPAAARGVQRQGVAHALHERPPPVRDGAWVREARREVAPQRHEPGDVEDRREERHLRCAAEGWEHPPQEDEVVDEARVQQHRDAGDGALGLEQTGEVLARLHGLGALLGLRAHAHVAVGGLLRIARVDLVLVEEALRIARLALALLDEALRVAEHRAPGRRGPAGRGSPSP
mmetsp:Transcript_67625/g.218406  ORF Transcript_67625/g.218406 Transcript_67625/m.218406 type:complete len:205 (+) Transcript_67625:777-1391(+)